MKNVIYIGKNKVKNIEIRKSSVPSFFLGDKEYFLCVNYSDGDYQLIHRYGTLRKTIERAIEMSHDIDCKIVYENK